MKTANKTTYLSLFDEQCGICMHTGRNTITREELRYSLLNYFEGDGRPEIDDGDQVGMDVLCRMTLEELCEFGEFAVQESETPFSDPCGCDD